jgi:endonuclease-3
MAPLRPGTRPHALAVVDALAAAYGPRPWRRHHPPVDELVTTVLSQSTTDANQHRAFAALREAFADGGWAAVREAPAEEVERVVRPAGLAAQKAPRIQAILRIVSEEPRGADLEWLGSVPLEEAMEYLTALPGVGPKTAACVLCFSFDRPVLPVDTHVHRIALRLGMVRPRTSAARTQAALTRLVPAEDVYATHMRLVAHGRTLCRPTRPRCPDCPLLSLCREGRRRVRDPAGRAPPGPRPAASERESLRVRGGSV